MKRTSWWCWSSSSRILRPEKEQKFKNNLANIRPQTPVLSRNILPKQKNLWTDAKGKNHIHNILFCWTKHWRHLKTLHSIFNCGAPVSPCDALEKISQAAKETLRNIYWRRSSGKNTERWGPITPTFISTALYLLGSWLLLPCSRIQDDLIRDNIIPN